ncbi:hypothetical protein GUJ93_ZPchr0008g12226 [Zizania palustris]|uniref:Uncharacterized protein n=1 Tax=Zizania palustris TaxID=103762 RepID=A0A8J5QWR1_ZIZPA|nr:hypothetical protein GUJ93_ZPchr0008g12226 [Zizania palustris]
MRRGGNRHFGGSACQDGVAFGQARGRRPPPDNGRRYPALILVRYLYFGTIGFATARLRLRAHAADPSQVFARAPDSDSGPFDLAERSPGGATCLGGTHLPAFDRDASQLHPWRVPARATSAPPVR